MRVLKFDGDNPRDVVIFNLLFSAWFYTDERGMSPIPVAANPERLGAALEVNKALRDSVAQVGENQFTLRPGKTELRIREVAFDLLRDFWRVYKQFVPNGLLERVKEVDDYLNEVPSDVQG